MFDYLQQFNKLPKNLRDQVSSPSAMATISELEAKYKVDLAIVIMKVMVKSIPLSTLPLYLSSEFSLPADISEQLARDLKEKVFSLAAEYLGLSREITAFDQDREIEGIIKEAGLILPSSMAVSRFKNIISTYNRGIRNKIDTKNTLAKNTKIGGLDLSPEEIERVLKICDSRLPKNSVNVINSSNFFAPAAAAAVTAIPSARLDKIVASADNAKPGIEYNLKQAIASGQVKKISAPEKELDLPLTATAEKIVSTEKIMPAAAPKTVPPIVNPIVPPVIHPIVPPIVHPIVPPIVPARPIVAPTPRVAKSIPNIQTSPLRPIASSRPVAVSSSSKTIMHDVKPIPKVMGPIEELQFLDLLNFRRLGKTPAEITAKIFSKIKLLEAEGYDKMVAGVHAWRQSPVNRLYLKMGQEAMNKGITIKDFAAASEKDNKNYLKLEEIEAILVMNSKLVF
jgi:hypothetical protein